MVARDRGQLLLLGGLAIAIVFLTAIPLSNSLVVSESASSSETVGDIDSTAQREAGVERGLRTLLDATDNRRPAALNRSVRNFTRYYTRVNAQQDGVYVNVTLNVTATEGNITRQPNSGKFQRPGSPGGPSGPSGPSGPGGPDNNNNWDLARTVTEIAIFNMTMQSDTGSGNNFDILVTGASGETNRIDADGDGSGATLTITRTYGSGPTETVCRGTTVELDLVKGKCDGATSGSLPPITDGLDEPYTVRFVSGQSVDGTYTFAATGQFPSSSYDDADYERYGVRPAFDVRYVGPDLSYNRTLVIDDSSASAAASPSDAVVYTGTGSGILEITGDNSATSVIGTDSEPTGLGPASDIDSDGTIEIPYVDGSGNLRLVTAGGDETLLVDGSSSNIYQPKTRLAVGTWDGSDPSVFYANDSSAISRVEPGGSPVLVADPGDDANAVVGPADIDDDGDDELVFADGSQTLQYLEDDGSIETLPNSGGGVSLGSSSTAGIGSGGIANYNNEGGSEVAGVDTGNNIIIANASDSVQIDDTDVDGGSAPQASKSPPTAADVDGDGIPELIYVSTTGDDLRYLDNIEAGYGSGNIEIKTLTDENGDPIDGDKETGVT